LDQPARLSVLGLALVALAVFIGEIALMRAVAQVTWPPFAWLALSAAMLGGGLAGTVLAVRPSWLRAPATTGAGALLVAVGAPVSVSVALVAGLEPLRVGSDLGATLVFVGVLLVLSTPFVGLALVLAALLERHPEHAFRLYAADLLGAGFGAFSSVVVIDLWGTAGAGVMAGALGAAGAALFLRGKLLQRAALLVAVGLALSPGWTEWTTLPRPTVEKRIGNLPARDVLPKLRDNNRLRTFDFADGRVDVIPASPSPALLIDLGAAVARAPEPDALRLRRADAASASFLASPPAGKSVLVIGSGAGYEVARALAHGAERVDAVEVSRAIVDAAQQAAGDAARQTLADPRVSLYVDEARSFLERGDASWDQIVAVHTITNAAVAASAMRLAEDFLLTRESISAMVSRLREGGVLYMTRPQAQVALLAELARAALVDRGVDPARVDEHLAMLAAEPADPFFAGLLVFASPVDRASLRAPPALRVLPPPAAADRALPTDARPFFHRLSDDVDEAQRARLRIEGPSLAEAAVAWTGALAALVALLAVIAPLWTSRRDRVAPPPLAGLGVAGLLGIGFMVVEIGLAQRLTLLCGRPVVAFAAVVGGMLLGAGSGALFASRRPVPLRRALLLSAGACVLAIGLPDLLYATGALAGSLPVRSTLAAVGSLIVALPLGLGFPALVRESAERAEGSAAWLYAVNAATGVSASALYAAAAPWLSLYGMCALAAAAYGLAALLAPSQRGGAR
jgi:hypothetical protein